jgi:hypothetical protein
MKSHGGATFLLSLKAAEMVTMVNFQECNLLQRVKHGNGLEDKLQVGHRGNTGQVIENITYMKTVWI